MEEQGIVSLWLGKAKSSDELEEALQVFYSEDGDFNGSEFTRGFQIEFYDENFKESEFLEVKENSLEFLLDGFSYDNVIIPRFLDIAELTNEKFNAVMLLYNFAYNSTVPEWQTGEMFFKFIGSVSYQT
jgi:Immunity protein 22